MPPNKKQKRMPATTDKIQKPRECGSVVSTDFSLMLLGSYLCELTYVAIDCEFGIWLIVEVLLYFSYVGPSIWTCELLIWVTWPPLVHS